MSSSLPPPPTEKSWLGPIRSRHLAVLWRVSGSRSSTPLLSAVVLFASLFHFSTLSSSPLASLSVLQSSNPFGVSAEPVEAASGGFSIGGSGVLGGLGALQRTGGSSSIDGSGLSSSIASRLEGRSSLTAGRRAGRTSGSGGLISGTRSSGGGGSSRVSGVVGGGLRETVERVVGGTGAVEDLDTAATLKGGLTATEGAGSVKDPDILDLASVQELAAMEPDLSSINEVLQELGATFYLEQSRDITMFMPTNEAFEKADIDFANLPWSAKWQILRYHIVPQYVIKLEDLSPGEHEYYSWEGSPIKVNIPAARAIGSNRRKYRVNQSVSVVGNPPGIENFNGISYKVDQLLIPESFSVSSMIIEDHQSSGITRKSQEEEDSYSTTESTSQSDDSFLSPSSSSSSFDDGRGKFVGRLDSESNLETGQETPQFVLDINAAHSQWNETPSERRSRIQASRGPTESGTSEIGYGESTVGLITTDADGREARPMQSTDEEEAVVSGYLGEVPEGSGESISDGTAVYY